MKDYKMTEPVWLSICNQKDLMCNNVFMNKINVLEQCNCSKKNTCLAIADLLARNHYDAALNILESTSKKQEKETS